MTELTVRQLAARLDDVEERHDAALKELRELRAEGAPPAKIEAAEEKVEETEAKVKTAEEEVAEAKATLKRHGYELDENDPGVGGESHEESAGVPKAEADGEEKTPDAEPTPAQEPPKEPKPDAEPEAKPHWYERTL